jgi:GT2 family glycosyltransferase
MTAPSVSIVIPVKGHAVVNELLDALLAIDKPADTETLVIDAMPGSLEDIRRLHPEVKWLYHRSKKKYTIPEQRNIGMREANGDIVVFIDADCTPRRQWLTELVAPLLGESENVAAGRVISKRRFPTRWEREYSRRPRARYVDFAPTMNLAIRSSVIASVGLYDERFEFGGEDIDYSWRVKQKGYKIRYVKSAEIVHDWGDVRRNALRLYAYGKANYTLLKKYGRRIPDRRFALATLVYAGYVGGVAVSLWWPWYILILGIPFAKSLLQTGSVIYAGETTMFNLVSALGFIAAGAEDVRGVLGLGLCARRNVSPLC